MKNELINKILLVKLIKSSIIISFIFTLSCNKKKEDPVEVVAPVVETPVVEEPEPEAPAAVETPRYLYVASGSCYSGGGNTTFTNLTASNFIYRINTKTKLFDTAFIVDYSSSPAMVGDSPVGLQNINENYLYALVENTTTTGARRIQKINKKTLSIENFSNNITALSTQVRNLQLQSNGDLLISKSTSIEKINSNNVRISKGANPYINAPAAPCATSTTLITKTQTLNNGFIAYTHAATSQNRVGFVKASGYSISGDCLSPIAAPDVAAFPVAMTYDSNNKILIVAYSGATTNVNINSIYAYTLDESSTSVSVVATNKIYDAFLYPTTYPDLLYGISDIFYDQTEKKLYVASAVSNVTTVSNYIIERFKYDANQIGVDNSKVIVRDSGPSFLNYSGYTKCISQMQVGY